MIHSSLFTRTHTHTQVLLSDPEDCARIARIHVKKSPGFTVVFADR